MPDEGVLYVDGTSREAVGEAFLVFILIALSKLSVA
jgi:hypothetical protein